MKKNTIFIICLSFLFTGTANSKKGIETNNIVSENYTTPIILALEAEDFQFEGGWTKSGRYLDNSGSGFLYSLQGADLPAVAAIEVPKNGEYTLWLRTVDFPKDRQGERYSLVSIGGRKNSKPFGKSGKEGWTWEKGDVFLLKKGPVLISLEDNTGIHSSRIDAIILSNDSDFVPKGNLQESGLQSVKAYRINSNSKNSIVKISQIKDLKVNKTLAKFENETMRVAFVSAMRDGKESAKPAIEIKTPTGWMKAPINPSAESYQVLSGGNATAMQIDGFNPKWKNQNADLTVEVGGQKVKTKTSSKANQVIWNAGEGNEAIIRSVKQLTVNKLQLDFYPIQSGALQAIWELQPKAKTILVEMKFIPSIDGQYSLGYFIFNKKPLADVQELLLPMMVQGKRFPSENYTLLQAACPTPVSLMQTAYNSGSITWGISGDPSVTPFEFPTPIKSRYGLHIRNHTGEVQPSIYGPLVGTQYAQAKAGGNVKFAFRIYVQSGDWYAGYRTIADDVFGLRDYRKNGDVSLTQATFNMIDLYMDDEFGGWWNRAKAPYQVESKNGSTQSSPLTAVSLYYLTGDKKLYQNRTLPTLEFLVSRDNPHFSPIPENTGSYAKGSMNGPVSIFGGSVYGSLWKMLNYRTPIFKEIAFPENKLRLSGTQQNFESHNQRFDEWLGRYLITGEKASLDSAITQADVYIENAIHKVPTRELGVNPFFLMAYTPAWEGLLRLYEVTKEKRFLDAAVKGARLVMTGMWTQPTPVDEMITIHPNGVVHGDKMDRKLHKGTDEFRLGWPRKENDTPEKQVPAWLVSNVGLGFEQPTTYTYKENGGRMILQAPWATGFLRLALYTGDKQFETYARNAVLGRWGNYPGYYYTTFTDLMQNPQYPYQGPDIGFIYYHHLLVHLSWTLDYLVSEAALRSNGGVHFPALRQFGYAYFDNLIYGNESGEIMGQKNVWLWFKKNLVSLNNSQINYLTAHTKDKFFVIMMNESSKPEKVEFTFQPKNISKGTSNFSKAQILLEKYGELKLTNNTGQLVIEPRGFKIIEVDGLDIEVSVHKSYPQPPLQSKCPAIVKASLGNGVEIFATSIQVEPGSWSAYIWSNAESNSLKEINLNWNIGNETGTIKDMDYPYEFSVPVMNGNTVFKFSTNGVKSDNSSFSTKQISVEVAD